MKTSLEKRLDNLVENDIAHLHIGLKEVKTDIKWLTKITWFILTTSVGALITSLLNLIK